MAAGLFTFLVITGIPPSVNDDPLTRRPMADGMNGCLCWVVRLNAVWLTDTAVKIPAGMFLAGAAGLLVGIFIGCLIGAIAELDMRCRCFSKESVSVRASVCHFSGWPSGGTGWVFHIDINASIK